MSYSGIRIEEDHGWASNLLRCRFQDMAAPGQISANRLRDSFVDLETS